MTEPDWVASSIWWHVYPLGALGADTTGRDRRPGRSLLALVDWLDHVIRLGANGLALGPIFQSTSHGYDTIDHFVVDDRIGTADDLTHLIEQCHRRGIRVMFDGVFNHVGAGHPLVAEPHSAVESGWARRDPRTGGLRTFEGHSHLVELDHRNPAVADMVGEIICHWLGRGIDGWRLDAAYAVPQEFWRHVIPAVKDRFPQAYLVGEVIHGDYADDISATGMDSVTQYELWKAVWSSITDANMHELAWALQRHNTMLDTFVPWTFVGNHDVTRIATTLADHHPQLATVLLATLPGTPAVYYGDELGWTGVKEEREGGDDAIRPELPPSAPTDADLPSEYRLHQRLIGIRRRYPRIHATRVVVEDVRQGLLRYRLPLDDGPDLVVALNANDHPAGTQIGAATRIDSDAAHQEGDMLQLEPGGWWIGET
ncbi:alpha-amylase family glycosyl hydrolase [Gordonia rhizosphera]|uniref:alpha-amylase family glycosyl hydrolase n=1 Tax=Gordonia rhizosphera TaxID=83341 RepID=UPI00030A6D47|nr:alpha-amylase family glycosyl hydrolase [Gordonia rhizosphera]